MPVLNWTGSMKSIRWELTLSKSGLIFSNVILWQEGIDLGLPDSTYYRTHLCWRRTCSLVCAWCNHWVTSCIYSDWQIEFTLRRHLKQRPRFGWTGGVAYAFIIWENSISFNLWWQPVRPLKWGSSIRMILPKRPVWICWNSLLKNSWRRTKNNLQ